MSTTEAERRRINRAMVAGRVSASVARAATTALYDADPSEANRLIDPLNTDQYTDRRRRRLMEMDRIETVAPHSVAHLIAAYRHTHDLNVRQFADAAGVSWQAVSQLEKGGALGEITASRLANILGVPKDDLLALAPAAEDRARPSGGPDEGELLYKSETHRIRRGVSGLVVERSTVAWTRVKTGREYDAVLMEMLERRS